MLMPVTVEAVLTTEALITNQSNNVAIRVISSGSLTTQESLLTQIGVYVTDSGLRGWGKFLRALKRGCPGTLVQPNGL